MGRKEHGARPQNSADLAACKDTSKRGIGKRDAAAKFATIGAYSTAHTTRVSKHCGNRAARGRRAAFSAEASTRITAAF